MEAFRASAIKAGGSPSTINICRSVLRAILRRVGPRETRNPAAKGFLAEVPYMKPCLVMRSIPRRLALDNEISRFYIACQTMESPRLGFPPAWWWQGLLTWYYCTGMRIRDALRIRFADLDWERWTVRFTASKTRKPAELPLHSVLLGHINRIKTDREFIFQSKKLYLSGDFHQSWRRICQRENLERPFTRQDLRRTAASEIDRAAASKGLPPMAGVLLQHSSRSVTDRHYLNQMDELREAMEALRLPLAFKHGPKEAEHQLIGRDTKRPT